jgi:aerobic carbon-monoxide dehydrogenase medium subunit
MFNVVAPNSIREAIEHLGDDAYAIAGGVSLVLLIKEGFSQPDKLVMLAGLRELYGIRLEADGALRIGAMSTHNELHRSEVVRGFEPELARMFGLIGNTRVRNYATIGGNLAHADPAQDPPPMLMVLDASVEIVGPAGTREVPVSDFFTSTFLTVLEREELIIAVRIPRQRRPSRCRYLKFLPKSADDYATLSVAVRLELDEDSVVQDARLALGGAGPTPILLREAPMLLINVDADEFGTVVNHFQQTVMEEVVPVTDARGTEDYKRAISGVLSARAVMAALAATPLDKRGLEVSYGR